MIVLLFTVVALLTLSAYVLGRRRSLVAAGGSPRALHSLPSHYGAFVALWCGLPAAILFLAWIALEPVVVETMVRASLPAEVKSLPPARLDLFLADARSLAGGGLASRGEDPAVREAARHYARLDAVTSRLAVGVVLAAALGGLAWAQRRVRPSLRARVAVERTFRGALLVCSTFAILTTVGIVLSLVFEAIRFFALVPVEEFLFGLHWSPQTALRPDQVGSSGAFGAVPVFAGTLLITAVAMAVAVPVGLLAAIYLAEYAHGHLRAVAKPLLEILAGIPTVVYGFFALITVGPLLSEVGNALGLDVASRSALAAGSVMGVMIIPFVSSLSDDVITAVPQALREGSYGLGATRSETIRRVVVPAALPGLVGAILLAASRAIGETMIVVLAAGLSANLTANPLEAVTTATVQITTLLTGDQEFDSAKTLAAFALGLVLFCATLVLNVIALRVVQRYREKYD